MAPFLISALITITAATPILCGNGELDDYNNAGLYRGYSGQPRIESGEALRWVQADIHKGRIYPSAEGYQCFHGDVFHYPTIEEWLSFDALWDINEAAILSGNEGDADTQRYIRESVLQVADESNVNPRLILAAVMQEASFNSDSFDPSDAKASILQMIQEGVQGTMSGGETGLGGPGYVQFLFGGFSWVHNPQPGNSYTAARSYNSGSVASDGNLDRAEWGTSSYANDIANQLIGWNEVGKGFKDCFDD